MEFLTEVWDNILTMMRKDFSQTMMNLWFESLSLVKLTETSAVVSIKNDFKRDMLVSKYKKTIEEYFKALGFDVTLTVLSTEKKSLDEQLKSIDNELSTDTLPNENSEFSNSSKSETVSFKPDEEFREGINLSYVNTENEFNSKNISPQDENFSGINNRYTFENFVVGSSNKFAHAACLAVASNPTNEYNPLFIHGSSGLGKTHLLYAMMNKVHSLNPKAKIVYIKGDDFTNQLIDSISKSTNSQFRDKYRKADMLLIDDIQFISGKNATQEEFFHTFNALYEDHKQIVLTSDRPPRDIQTLEDRLKTRFEWGLIADVQPPDYELRIAILKKKAEALKIDIPNDVLQFLAENLKNNVRQLEGAVKKLGAQSLLTGAPIKTDLAITCVADLLTGSEPVTVTVDRILNKISKKYGVSIEEIKGRKRTKNIAFARHVSAYIMRNMTTLSLPAIGNVLGRNHATIMNSLDTIENEIAVKPLLEIEIKELINEIKEQ